MLPRPENTQKLLDVVRQRADSIRMMSQTVSRAIPAIRRRACDRKRSLMEEEHRFSTTALCASEKKTFPNGDAACLLKIRSFFLNPADPVGHGLASS